MPTSQIIVETDPSEAMNIGLGEQEKASMDEKYIYTATTEPKKNTKSSEDVQDATDTTDATQTVHGPKIISQTEANVKKSIESVTSKSAKTDASVTKRPRRDPSNQEVTWRRKFYQNLHIKDKGLRDKVKKSFASQARSKGWSDASPEMRLSFLARAATDTLKVWALGKPEDSIDRADALKIALGINSTKVLDERKPSKHSVGVKRKYEENSGDEPPKKDGKIQNKEKTGEESPKKDGKLQNEENSGEVPQKKDGKMQNEENSGEEPPKRDRTMQNEVCSPYIIWKNMPPGWTNSNNVLDYDFSMCDL